MVKLLCADYCGCQSHLGLCTPPNRWYTWKAALFHLSHANRHVAEKISRCVNIKHWFGSVELFCDIQNKWAQKGTYNVVGFVMKYLLAYRTFEYFPKRKRKRWRRRKLFIKTHIEGANMRTHVLWDQLWMLIDFWFMVSARFWNDFPNIILIILNIFCTVVIFYCGMPWFVTLQQHFV